MDISNDYVGTRKFPHKKTIETPYRVARHATDWAKQLVRDALPELPIMQRNDMNDLLGLGRQPRCNPHASNLAVRDALIDRSIVSLLGAWRDSSEREMQFLTFTPDTMHISEERPEIRLKEWRDQCRRWLDQVGFTGMGVIEFAPHLNHPAAKHGRVISAHLHAIGYADDPRDFSKRVAEFSGRNKSRCSIGAFAFAEPIKMTEEDVAMVAYYIFEPPHWAKRLTPSRILTGKLKHRKAELPQHLALRCAEIMSYMKVTDLIVTRGTAAWLWRQELVRSVDMGDADAMLDRRDLDRLWASVWKDAKDRDYRRVELAGS